MISRIYESDQIYFKVGERKGQRKMEIQKRIAAIQKKKKMKKHSAVRKKQAPQELSKKDDRLLQKAFNQMVSTAKKKGALIEERIDKR